MKYRRSLNIFYIYYYYDKKHCPQNHIMLWLSKKSSKSVRQKTKLSIEDSSMFGYLNNQRSMDFPW